MATTRTRKLITTSSTDVRVLGAFVGTIAVVNGRFVARTAGGVFVGVFVTYVEAHVRLTGRRPL